MFTLRLSLKSTILTPKFCFKNNLQMTAYDTFDL